MTSMPKVVIHTDDRFGNLGPAAGRHSGSRRASQRDKGGETLTTNNHGTDGDGGANVEAIVNMSSSIPTRIICGGITQWIKKWKVNGWHARQKARG
jgi:hypothetical protein